MTKTDATGATVLLPCPFCRGEAEFVRKGSARQSCIIACTDCGCRLESGEVWSSGERWNTRAVNRDSQFEAMVGALEHARARFRCLEDEFKESGDTVSWAMCSVDADRMDKALSNIQASK